MSKAATLYPPLRAMQARQKAHDRDYSRDLMGMPLWGRLAHYAMHQGKYLGRLGDFDPQDPKFTFNRIVTDAYVVTLATANALGIQLERQVKDRPPLPPTAPTPAALHNALLLPQARLAEALLNYAGTSYSDPAENRLTARLQAKRQIQGATVAFCRILTGAGNSLGLDLDDLHEKRLALRASTSLFHPQNPAQLRLTPP